MEITTDLSQVTDKLYHIMLCWVHIAWAGFELTTLVVIGTDCIGSQISNYHTTMAAPTNCVDLINVRWINVINKWKKHNKKCLFFSDKCESNDHAPIFSTHINERESSWSWIIWKQFDLFRRTLFTANQITLLLKKRGMSCQLKW